MSNGAEETGGQTIPKEFWTRASFGTVAGCAVVTWLVAGVLGDVFNIANGALGLVVAIVVSYARLFVGKKTQRTGSQMVLAFFNGFLIYATVVGGTSFMPFVNPNTAEPTAGGSQVARVSLTTPWVSDKNMVKKTRSQARVIDKVRMDLEEISNDIVSPGFSRTQIRQKLDATKSNIANFQIQNPSLDFVPVDPHP
jgi:hypothetical protein